MQLGEYNRLSFAFTIDMFGCWLVLPINRGSASCQSRLELVSYTNSSIPPSLYRPCQLSLAFAEIANGKNETIELELGLTAELMNRFDGQRTVFTGWRVDTHLHCPVC